MDRRIGVNGKQHGRNGAGGWREAEVHRRHQDPVASMRNPYAVRDRLHRTDAGVPVVEDEVVGIGVAGGTEQDVLWQFVFGVEVRKESVGPTEQVGEIGFAAAGGQIKPRQKSAVVIGVQLERYPDLAQVRQTLHGVGLLACRGKRRQQDADQHGDDADDDKKLDKREGAEAVRMTGTSHIHASIRTANARSAALKRDELRPILTQSGCATTIYACPQAVFWSNARIHLAAAFTPP